MIYNPELNRGGSKIPGRMGRQHSRVPQHTIVPKCPKMHEIEKLLGHMGRTPGVPPKSANA